MRAWVREVQVGIGIKVNGEVLYKFVEQSGGETLKMDIYNEWVFHDPTVNRLTSTASGCSEKQEDISHEVCCAHELRVECFEQKKRGRMSVSWYVSVGKFEIRGLFEVDVN